MLPMSSSSHNLSRRKPNSRRQPLVRSSSLLGTLKNIVTAPLAWFANDFEDFKGKRRRLPQSNPDSSKVEDGPSRTKKMRVHSPDRQTSYLDPPSSIFPSQRVQSNVFTNLPNRSISITLPPNTIEQPTSSRPSLSPSRPHMLDLSRTMSIDPPFIQRASSNDVTMAPPPPFPTRDVSMEPGNSDPYSFLHSSVSASRDLSMPPLPSRSSFRLRTSMTPQPSGSSFGRSFRRRERDASEPPPLSSLISKPTFLRVPVEQTRPLSVQPTPTLGSIVEARRSTHSPMRQHSSLTFAPRSGETATASLRPINPAEKALHELDVYKTPLLPTRLRGSTAIPDMFKPRKLHPLTLMYEKDEKSRLGQKGGELVNGLKPYAGEGGMKKLLARRKMEADEEKEQTREMEKSKPTHGDALKLGRDIAYENAKGNTIETTSAELNLPPPLPPVDNRFNPRPANREQSSLRVGRTKASRSHPQPVSRPNKNRFSAAFDDEDDQIDAGRTQDPIMLEDIAKKAPLFELPPMFSFATEAVPIQHDSSTAKEPPITSLPFSFTKLSNSGTSTSSTAFVASSHPPLPPTKSTARTTSFGPSPSGTSNNNSSSAFNTGPTLAPSIASPPPPPPPSPPPAIEIPKLAPPPVTDNTPATLPATLPATTSNSSNSSIPNFFVNSSAFSKPLSVVTPSFSMNINTSAITPTEKDEENLFWEADKKVETKYESNATNDVRNEMFGNFQVPALSGTPWSNLSTSIGKGKESEPTTSIFGAPAKSTTQVTAALPSSAPDDKSAPLSFPSTQRQISSSLFGPKEPEAPKAPFGSGSTSVIGSDSASLPSVSTEATKSSFLFDQPKTSIVATPAHSSEPPKVPFGAGSGFSFSSSSSKDSTLSSPSTGPFSFRAPPSTPPAADKLLSSTTFSFVAPSPVSPNSGFTFRATNESGIVSTPFTFGTHLSSDARPVTPPRINSEQEFRMEESPTRDMQMNGNSDSKSELRPSLGFSFNAPNSSGSSLFSQPGISATMAPFSFVAPCNPFEAKAESKLDDKPASVGFGSGFGQPQIQTSGPSFGQKPHEIEPPRPSTTGSFSFQSTPTSTSGAAFTFGPSGNINGFGQQSGSAPNSPSTFSQPSPFSFAPPSATSTSNPFSFGGSQPVSPAAAINSSLPQAQPSTSSGFVFSPHTAAPASPFGATAPPPGGALFTIGAAPTAAPPAGARPLRKLPNRNRGSKR